LGGKKGKGKEKTSRKKGEGKKTQERGETLFLGEKGKERSNGKGENPVHCEKKIWVSGNRKKEIEKKKIPYDLKKK